MTNEINGQKWMPWVLGGMAILLLAVVYLFKVAVFSGNTVKIAYVKSDVILAQYIPAQAVQRQLQSESSHAQRELEGRYSELQEMNKDLQRKSQVLTSQALAPQMSAFQQKQNEFMQLQESHQQALQQKQSELLGPIFQDISNFITKYGRDHGYTMILGTPVDGVLVYGDPAADLTDIIVAEMNTKVPPSMPVPMPSLQDSTKK